MAFRMTEATFNEKYWSYYLSLEKDVFDFSAYVPIHPDNMQTFSPCYRKMLILIAMEFEIPFLLLCFSLSSFVFQSLFHRFYHGFDKINFFLCQVVFCIEFGIGPRFGKILNGDKTEFIFRNIHRC